MKPIVIIGAGGYAQELTWIIEDTNAAAPAWELLGYIDPARPERKGERLYDFPVLGGFEAASGLPAGVAFACGIGEPRARARECLKAEELGWEAATLVHPTVVLARHVVVEPGTVIGAGSIVAPYARIGRHCAVNLHVTIGHNSRIGDFCVISPGARVSGGAKLGTGCFLGTNATVYLGRSVGDGASLGANSFLLTDLPPNRTAIGVPAASFGKSTGAGTCSAQEDRASRKDRS